MKIERKAPPTPRRQEILEWFLKGNKGGVRTVAEHLSIGLGTADGCVRRLQLAGALVETGEREERVRGSGGRVGRVFKATGFVPEFRVTVVAEFPQKNTQEIVLEALYNRPLLERFWYAMEFERETPPTPY